MTKRYYDQFCAAACALDVIGERWALLIVRELLPGPKRFVDLEAGLPGIGTNTLATRLSELEAAGVIERRQLPAPAASAVYALTDWGRDLEPIVIAMARWGVRRLVTATPRHPLRASWLATALQAFFRRDAVRDVTAVVELVLPTGTLNLHLRRGNLAVKEGPVEGADLRITTTEQGIFDLLRGRSRLGARRRHNLRVEGNDSLVERLVEAFPMGADNVQ
jgi:DNA-binding HxlR family transcriptional regulator